MAPSGAVRLNLITESRRPPIARAALIALALGLSAASPAGAQFSSGVNVVEVYATVTDARGAPVPGLTREDFVVRENGEAQPVTTFAAGEFPLAVALAIDHSFSMAGDRLSAARSAAREFLGALRAEDESMLIGVGSETGILAPLSRERPPQYDALAKLRAFGTTGLHDAIVAAIDAIGPARGRRALVLLSDGDDRYSTTTAAAALAAARASDVMIYPIAFGRSRPPLFAELAALTGGRSYHVRDARQLPATMRAIALELRHQYLLGYTPSRPIVAGTPEWRSISVTVGRPATTVRARDGYAVK